MAPWEKRLADLADLLTRCHQTYMEPELFRRSINLFLQTARTVTFIIQKNKETIPNFTEWYQGGVIDAWKGSVVMQWAKDARNTIEKEGDLDLQSTVSLKLFFGYLENQDLDLEIKDPRLLHAGVKRLVRVAQKNLPSGVSRAAAIKVERQWVADSLPNHELLTTLCVIYRKLHELCKSLAIRLNSEMSAEIPDPTEFDDIAQETRQTKYFKLSSSGSFSMRAERKSFKRGDLSPELMAQVTKITAPFKDDKTIDGVHAWLAEMAEATFTRDGYHGPIAFLHDSTWAPIDMISFRPDDTTDKYIIWRDIGERVRSKGSHAVSFVGEAWIRDATNRQDHAISSLPIIGEQLQVVTVDRSGNYRHTRWDISREEEKPTLRRLAEHDAKNETHPAFLAPVMAALGISELTPKSGKL